jgi:hypothetical protein
MIKSRRIRWVWYVSRRGMGSNCIQNFRRKAVMEEGNNFVIVGRLILM